MWRYLSLAAVATIKHPAKTWVWGGGAYAAYSPSTAHHSRAGTREQAQSSWYPPQSRAERNQSVHVVLLLVFSLISPLQFRTAFPGRGATHSGLGPPTSVNLIKTIPTDTPVGQPNVDSATPRISAQVILDCVTLKWKAFVTDIQDRGRSKCVLTKTNCSRITFYSRHLCK